MTEDDDEEAFRRAAKDLPKMAKLPKAVTNRMGDYPKTNSGPLCKAEETGYLNQGPSGTGGTVFCPFASDAECHSGCPTNRERICILGEDD
jgi:hypothetical protein